MNGEDDDLEFYDLEDNDCPFCGLSMIIHDGDGFCPPGTEEFGGRR